MKLYRYRPLNEFLFKELFYQELYFASYLELNDPLDLSARIDFSPNKSEDLEDLLTYILFTSYRSRIGKKITQEEKNNNDYLAEFSKNERETTIFCSKLYTELTRIKSIKKYVSIEDLEQSLELVYKSQNYKFKIDIQKIRNKLQRQTKKFLQNSSAICFSENNNNFLMWSHYASKHSGICLEFLLEKPKLPYKYLSDSQTHEKFQQDFAGWKNEGVIFTELLRKVKYQQNQPYINFFQFSFIFIDEHSVREDDVDHELSEVFSLKTTPWKYEKEWRAVQLNFKNNEQPEDRIRHYPIQCLTAIYFGIRTPKEIKFRIYNIFKLLKKEIIFFDSIQTDTRKLKFKKWEYIEE